MKCVLSIIQSLILFPLFSTDYVVYEVTAFNPHEREFLYYLHVKQPTITFLNGVSNEAAIPMDVIVENKSAYIFEKKLISYDIQYTFVAVVSKQQLVNRRSVKSDINISSAFNDFENIQNWVDNNEKNNLAFNKIVIGKTFENRDIFILKLSKKPKKPIVFIVGGEDGKDWLSSAIVLNVLDELLNKSSNFSSLLNIYDFYLLPLLNPDGFVFSRYENRLWTKNRQIDEQKRCNGSYAVGVNIERNWFTEKSSKMADMECHSVYVGHKGLSEGETQILSYVLNSVSLNMLAFINIRGFGRYITIPYAKATEKANNHDIVMEILKSACSNLFQKHNATFYYESTEKLFCKQLLIHEMLYSNKKDPYIKIILDNFSGNMADWVKSKLNTPLVYTVYLEDISTILPMPNQILPLSEEFYTLLYDTLIISNQMYGPLYNSQNPGYYCHYQMIVFSLTHIFLKLYCVYYI